MSYDPYKVVCEILGQNSNSMPNPVSVDYRCPFTESRCKKRSKRSSEPFPVCSVFRSKDGKLEPIIVCPKRFFEIDLIHDVINNCWVGDKPKNPIYVHEIKMGDIGNVDMVVADLSSDGNSIRDFVSIELQAIDITGSYEPAYTSIILGSELDKKPIYSFNYRNVQKRFVTQLINKGFFHHHWNTKIIAVVQDIVFDDLHGKIKFAETPIDKSNIVFMQYTMKPVFDNGEFSFKPVLKSAVGTTHNELMMSSLYQITPPKNDFCDRILKKYKEGNWSFKHEL